MTQEEKVLRHLKQFGTITSWEAIMEYGITRLSAKIFNLRKEGYDIGSERVTAKNRFGENCTFAKYFLKNALQK